MADQTSRKCRFYISPVFSISFQLPKQQLKACALDEFILTICSVVVCLERSKDAGDRN